MFKLHSLEVSGFKSFCDSVSVRFAGGITGIVGPNGCGKSNLADAMTWVLGEQSAKSLRGGTMEDVIFSGSEQRKPLGMAEVSLTLETDPSLAGTEDGRLTLGRRVFRNGESQYRLNGKTVRLKEIRDLLMDTGLGIRAYSVIEQGKIGMILSGKPQERRRLLEEAAGITRYKARKRIAEFKLEEATANLLRLDDVISEVERSLRSLKRQASAARRYQQAEREHRDLLRRVLAARWQALAGRLSDLDGRLAATQAEEAGVTAALHRDEADLAAARELLDRRTQEVAERHRRQGELSATIEGRQQLARGHRQRIEEIVERLAQSRVLAERRDEEMAAQTEGLEEVRERRNDLLRELEAASQEVTLDDERIARAEADLRATAARLESVRARLLSGMGEVEGLRAGEHRARIELEKATYRERHLAGALADRAAELEEAERGLATADQTVAGLGHQVDERGGRLDRVQASLETTLRREAEATEARRDLEERLSEIRQRQRLLSELRDAHTERRARLETALAEARVGGQTGPSFLAAELSAVAGWERSLDFYLAELADAVLVGDEEALPLARELAEARVAATLIRQLPGLPESWPAVDDPALVLSLGEALGLSEELAAALPPAFLVEDAADAERLARRHPGVAFLAREGLWAEGGALHVEAEGAVPGLLERERELAELGEEVPRLQAELAAAVAAVERLIAQRAGFAKDANRFQGELAHLRQELAVARARREDSREVRRRLEAEHAALLEERAALEADVAEIRDGQDRLATELAEAEAGQKGLSELLENAQAEVEAAKEVREGLRTESAGRRGHLDLLRERRAALDRDLERLETSLVEGRRQVEAWREEGERLSRRRGELEAELATAEDELQAALEERAGSERELAAAQEALADERRAVQELEDRLATTRERRDEVRSRVEELRVEQAGLRQNAEHLAGDFREHFDEELPPAAADAAAEVAELPVLESSLARTKATLERLGPVNLLAVEEHAQEEERYGFLGAQRTDVAESVESLKRTIREINQTSSARFVETFVTVNRAFSEVFARLFRGGEAEMRLLDEEDVLESGIEIVARPPGKRLQNISLMSGGEKALTAIALLFALFQSKPSPFCILDEVDAPLDDVNTVRFAELLREMCRQTQFIVITHNKITMEGASTLYGVTMEERGVSKLVSVEVDDVQPEPRVATA